MKILCLTTRIDRPSTRYRLIQFLPYLNSGGIETEVVVVQERFKRWGAIKGADRYSGVFIQKKMFSRVEQWYLRKKAKKIIYDFDDAIMYTKSKYSKSTKRYERFKFMMGVADLVISGNKYLADLAGEEYRDKAVIIPTVIDVARYPLHSRGNSGITLGWIGTRSTQVYLDMIEPIFSRLIKKYSEIQIKIVSDAMPGFCRDKIVWEKWCEDKELDALNSFDIGLMPLREDPWTIGKCGFKIIQYMAVGVPVVCSPVGVNTEIVKNGVNGFYASTFEEWEMGISRLIDDIDLYRKMSAASRQTIEKGYNLSYWGPYLTEVLRNTLEPRMHTNKH